MVDAEPEPYLSGREIARARTAANGGIAPVERHGTKHVADYWACKCGDCLAAQCKAGKAGRRSRYARTAANGGIAPVPKEKHGKATTAANWGCTCPECKDAMSTYNRLAHERRRQSAG